jgi:hypothetical protein
MRIRRPECGNSREVHGAHRFARWSSDTELGGSCQGWSEREVDVTVMVGMVLAVVDRNELDHPVASRRPELRVEIHPAVRHCLAQMVIPDGPLESTALGMGLPALFGVPLVVSPELVGPGSWRVVEVGKTLTSGAVR